MDVSAFLRNDKLAASVVGRKLNDLVWPDWVNENRMKEPDADKLNLAPEIPTEWIWEGVS